MPNPRLAARYAKCLFDLALEKGELEKVHEDMQMLNTICKKSRDFVNFLNSPIIPVEKKEKIIGPLFKDKISPLTGAFTRLLVKKGREINFPEITTAFIEQYKAHYDIHTLKLTTAVPVSEEIKKDIVDKVQKRINVKQIELVENINPDVIGGFRMELSDYLLDSTVQNVLKKVKAQFKNNDFVFRLR